MSPRRLAVQIRRATQLGNLPIRALHHSSHLMMTHISIAPPTRPQRKYFARCLHEMSCSYQLPAERQFPTRIRILRIIHRLQFSLALRIILITTSPAATPPDRPHDPCSNLADRMLQHRTSVNHCIRNANIISKRPQCLRVTPLLRIPEIVASAIIQPSRFLIHQLHNSVAHHCVT